MPTLPSFKIWEDASPPPSWVWLLCKLMIATSIVFVAFILCMRREMEQRDNYVTIESHSWEKSNDWRTQINRKLEFLVPMNRQLYLQCGFTVHIFKVHIFELYHNWDPIIADFWDKSSLPFPLDRSQMQKGCPVLLPNHSVMFFKSPLNKRWHPESHPVSCLNPNLWHPPTSN